MITDERLNQMDAEAVTITARGTVAGLALGTFVLELTAEVRRLRRALAAERTARQAAEVNAARLVENLENGRRMHRNSTP